MKDVVYVIFMVCLYIAFIKVILALLDHKVSRELDNFPFEQGRPEYSCGNTQCERVGCKRCIYCCRSLCWQCAELADRCDHCLWAEVVSGIDVRSDKRAEGIWL